MSNVSEKTVASLLPAGTRFTSCHFPSNWLNVYKATGSLFFGWLSDTPFLFTFCAVVLTEIAGMNKTNNKNLSRIQYQV